MPYVAGESLRSLLVSRRQLPLDEAIRITCDVLAALSYAHPAAAVALVRDLARTIRADVEWRRGRSAEALKLLEPVRGEVPPELLVDPFFSEEGARYLRAELLYQLGDDREALQWFSNGFQGTPNEVAFLAPIHLRQAELYERLGDKEQAINHYSRFIRLWNSCDPELRPSVERARQRMSTLVAEPR